MPAILSACGAVRGEIFLIFPRLTSPQIKPIKVQINVMGGCCGVGVLELVFVILIFTYHKTTWGSLLMEGTGEVSIQVMRSRREVRVVRWVSLPG